MVATFVVCAATATPMALVEGVLLILCSNRLILQFLQQGRAISVGRRRGHTGAHHHSCLHPAVSTLSILVTLGPTVADWLDPAPGGQACWSWAAHHCKPRSETIASGRTCTDLKKQWRVNVRRNNREVWGVHGGSRRTKLNERPRPRSASRSPNGELCVILSRIDPPFDRPHYQQRGWAGLTCRIKPSLCRGDVAVP